MNFLVLDTEFNAVTILDMYESSIWTDRYQEPGDFEIYMSTQIEILNRVKEDYYLINRNSEHAMIVEAILIKSDVEEGSHITISGRSLESILDRRIVWGQLVLSGDLQNGIKKLLTHCIINPSDSDRKIDNFVFEESDDPLITELTIDAQYTGDNLLDVVQKICSDHEIGFKITFNDQMQFVFKLYAGADRSYDQFANPYVVFSPKFENIINSNYLESNVALKTVTLVGGEGEGSARRYATVSGNYGSGTGLSRREIFTDARDISSDTGDTTLSESEYNAQLQQRGKETLAENTAVVSFEGQVETTLMYRYGEDFFMGDIVQIANEYGHETKVRVIELVTSESEEGISVYPTFTTLAEERSAAE